jgi:hypothetical protein
MEREDLIPADELCNHYQVAYSFITELQEHGLIRIETVSETSGIPAGQLSDLERFIRLHYDLDINLEGIEAIHHLLQRIQQMQDEMNSLRNRLGLYED